MMRNYFKQLHSLQRALLFVLFAQLFTLTMMAEEVFVDGIKYNAVKKAKQAIVIANSYSGDVVIPSSFTYDNVEYSVTAIGMGAFYDCRQLTSVTIPESVKSIGGYAFSNCFNLTKADFASIESLCKIEFLEGGSNPLCSADYLYINGQEVTDLVIPNSVTSIGQYAFEGCSGLKSVTISESVTSIGNYAFEGCSGLTSVIIPHSVNTMGTGTFQRCTSLTSVTIGCSVTSIETDTFFGCSSLISVIIPNSVTSIGHYVFQDCSNLASVIIPNSVTSIGVSAFAGCSNLTSVTIPNGVTSIGGWTFEGCSGLTSVTIGNSVTSIDMKAFANCVMLMDVYCLATNVPTAYSTAFDGSYPEYITLHVPEEAVENYRSTAPWSSFGTILPLPLVGDANGNGEVEIGDITSVLTLMATPEATGYDNQAADANGNGVIEIGDVTTILTIMAGE
jgi:hypothetical protein